MLPLSMNPNPYCIGLDLGQSNDYTALAIVETVGNDGRVTHWRSQAKPAPYLHLRHLERYPLRTPYPEIADGVAALVRSKHLVTHTTDEMLNSVPLYPELVIDQTGVGAPVADLLAARALEFLSVIITGGEKAHGGARFLRTLARE